MSPGRLALAVLAVALLPLPAAAAAPLPAPAKVRLATCAPALEQADRFAVVEGEMRAVPGAARLQLRFVLQARTPDRAGWTRVPAPGFGAWISATAGVRRFVYTKRVENLFAPARYRVVAKFRWLSWAGAVVARDERRTSVCRQPDQRANLTPLRIDVMPGSAGDSRSYVIPVLNEGRLDATHFSVRLTVNGLVQPAATVTGLPAGDRTLLALEAPACSPGTAITALVDAEGVIDEADEADNTVTASCPAEA